MKTGLPFFKRRFPEVSALAGLALCLQAPLATAQGLLEVQTTAVPDTAVEESLASVLGIQAVDRAGRGAYLAGVRRDGAAARRGLRVGDVVLAVNGTPSADAAALREAIRQARSSHRASALFTVLRGDVVARLTLPI